MQWMFSGLGLIEEGDPIISPIPPFYIMRLFFFSHALLDSRITLRSETTGKEMHTDDPPNTE